MTDSRVVLTWTIPSETGQERTRITGCTVQRAQRALEDSNCIDCIASFEKIADVEVPRDSTGRADPQRFRFTEPLRPGFEYAYRVVCSTAAGVYGDASNVVRFETPEPTTQQP